jgi:outer membrane protein TolC
MPPASLLTQTPTQTSGALSLDEALRLAGVAASDYTQAQLNERIAAEDVRQAQAAFLPRVTSPNAYTYTSPQIGLLPGEPRTQSFIANNAISEYQSLVNVAGDVDIAGRLRATLERNRALLAAAHAGTEVARRALNQAVVAAYYGLALATAERRAAELNLAAAEEFERITDLLLTGGEVAPVDLIRARVQTITRRDELERARADEAVAADSLRTLVGYDFTQPINASDLAIALPANGEIEQYTADLIARRPEFAQFEAERRAAEQEVRVARAERLPQLSYSVSGGFDSDSAQPVRIKEHTGVAAELSLSIPIFDFGASRSRERQAQLRAQLAETERAQALRAFAQQFYTARTQAASAATRIRLAGAGLAQAQSNLDASIARYRAGEAQIIEVTDALTTLAAQRTALYQAIFDYQTALARLRQAAGR